MSRSLIAFLLVSLAPALHAAEFMPRTIGPFHRVGAVKEAPKPSDSFDEFGLLLAQSAEFRGRGSKGQLTIYKLKDASGALAAWTWTRPSNSKHCALSERCAEAGNRRLVLDANYLLDFQGFVPSQADVQALVAGLPDRHPSALPPVINFVPLQDLVPNSSRYILGPKSLRAVAPELASANPGFDQSGEAYYTAYWINGAVVKLVLFYYPSPGIARQHTVAFRSVPGAQVKRSTVLVAIVLPGASPKDAEALLDHVRYGAKISWNEQPPPNAVAQLYRLLVNIIIICVILIALAALSGVFYGLMRVYRRRYGSLEEDEAMTTLHLTVGP
ncbi:MAG TPA: DUF6599 family protein [Bryobacteraceae bacterium]|nr:DUF6599 family protein [Bryobacteraceae bacterium]